MPLERYPTPLGPSDLGAVGDSGRLLRLWLLPADRVVGLLDVGGLGGVTGGSELGDSVGCAKAEHSPGLSPFEREDWMRTAAGFSSPWSKGRKSLCDGQGGLASLDALGRDSGGP